MTDIILLDGGMGQELTRRAGDKPTPLWSTQVMIDHPGMVAAVHADYAAAGATVHTTNTYAILRDRLKGTPFESQFEALHAAAIKEAAGVGVVAGSLGPLGASYRPDLMPPHDTAVATYKEVANQLAPSVDLLICETVASVAHARAVLAAAIAELARGDLPFGGYANGFVKIADGFLTDKPTVDALTAREDLDPAAYAAFAMDWIAQGATIVGGCCEVGPAHISELARRIRAAHHRIVAP